MVKLKKIKCWNCYKVELEIDLDSENTKITCERCLKSLGDVGDVNNVQQTFEIVSKKI